MSRLVDIHCPHCGQVPQEMYENMCEEDEKATLDINMHWAGTWCQYPHCGEHTEYWFITRCEHCAGYFQVSEYYLQSCGSGLINGYYQCQIEKL